MKHLKSTLAQLRALLDRGLSTKYIMENICSFDELCECASILEFMHRRDFDAVGIKRDGNVIGFVERTELEREGGTIRPTAFAPSDCLSDHDSISLALRGLEAKPRVWVQRRDTVTGIVTRGDLQKAPVRMWLFAEISLLEMQLLRIVRARYPDGSWTGLVTTERIAKARAIQKNRHRRNQGIDLEDCLQFSDKSRIVVAEPGVFLQLGFASARAALTALREIEDLRNLLAHSQDIVSRDVSWLARMARDIEGLLARCEAWSPVRTLNETGENPRRE
jgi:hypothetical protein